MTKDLNLSIELLTEMAALDQEAREADYQAELGAAKNSFEAYWAGSASASVARDYRAGRVVTIHAGRK